MTTLLLGIHSFGTVDAAQVVGKSGTKPAVSKSSTGATGKSSVKAVRGTVGKSTFKPLVTKPASKPVTKPKVAQGATPKIATSRTTAAVVIKNQVEQVSTRVRVENTPDVRVLLGSRRQDASVSSSSGVTVLNSAKGKIENHKVVSVGIRGNKIAVNGKAIDSVVTLKPASGDIFTFEGKSYRGALTLRANNGTMMVINEVPLES